MDTNRKIISVVRAVLRRHNVRESDTFSDKHTQTRTFKFYDLYDMGDSTCDYLYIYQNPKKVKAIMRGVRKALRHEFGLAIRFINPRWRYVASYKRSLSLSVTLPL